MRKFYSGIFTLFLFLSFASTVQAQLSGTKTIPGDYPTIASAVTDLNAAGVGAGGVTFLVAPGHTENTTAAITITASASTASPIEFVKDGAGVNPKITRTDAGTLTTSALGGNGDAIVRIDGGDGIKFQEIDLQANNQGIEYGYFANKTSATNGVQNLWIVNCTVTMTKGTSAYVIGIHIGNGTTSLSSATGVTVTALSGRNTSIGILGNTIQNVHAGIYNRGSSASGFYDENFDISSNTIQNYGGGSATSTYGFYFIYQNNVTTNANIINNAAGGGIPHTATLYGIFYSTIGGTLVADGNTITMNNSSTSGSHWINNGTNPTTTASISSNTFAGTIAATSASYLIYNNNSFTGPVTVNGNTISGTIAKTGVSGGLHGYYNNGSPSAGTETISNNSFSNVTLAGTSSFTGIQSTTAAAAGHTIFGNTISNISGGTGTITGINVTSANSRNIYSNQIHTLSNGGTVVGITTGSGFTSGAIYRNKIYGLSSTSTATTVGLVSGISVTGGTSPVIHNNLIGDLQLPNSGSSDGIRGINITSTTTSSSVSLYYNTIYINAATAGALFGSSGVFHTASATATTAALDMRNNIIVNTSAPTGAGITAALRRSAAALDNYSTSSNNNLFYAGTPSATQVIYHNGTTGYQTIGDFKADVAPREMASFTEMPAFLSTAGSSPMFLHIDPAVPTQLESGGSPVAGITDDYDGQIRNATTPDVGADEFAGTPADFSAPGIVYSDIVSSCDQGNRSLTATISDGSGVATGANAPRIYYSKNGGAWFSQQGTMTGGTVMNGTWSFSIVASDMGGLTNGDVVSYYVIAQDINGNVGSNPSGAVATNVNTVTTHPSSPSTYTVQSPMSGTILVGTGQTYATLTAAVNAYHNSCLTGAVTFALTDASYPAETFPIVINQHVDASAVNTLTIKPNTGVNATISGSSASAIIKLNGADYVTIDGSNNGTTSRNLTLENTSTLTNTAVVWVSSLGTAAGATNNTIKNTNIKGGSNTVSSVFGIHVGGTSISTTGSGADNDDLTLHNNAISKAYYGIYAVGTAAGVNDDLVVTSNEIGSATATDYITFRGTQISQTTNALIEKNRVFNIISGTTNLRGMEFGVGVTNTLVSKNVITEINYTGTSFSAGKGMTFISGAGANITISNNMISALKGHGSSTATNNSWGIMLSDGSGYNVYYNSINIPDNRSTTGSTDHHGGIFIGSTVSNVDLRNNIISVTGMPGNVTSGRMYAVYSLVISPSSPFTVSDYNDLYVSGTNHSVGYYHTANRNTLADWQLATGQDANSVSVMPVFVSPTDLHLQIGSNSSLNGAATPIGSVTTDIDDNARDAVNPDMGADEFSPPPGADVGITALVSPAATGCYTATETVAVTLNNFSGSTIDFSIQPVTVNVTATGPIPYASAFVVNSGTLASGGSMTVTMPTTIDMTGQGTYTFNATTVIAGDINPANDAMPATTRSGIVFNGTYTVGVGGNFTTLTEAVNTYNSSSCITGPVVFSLIDATYPSETFPITINDNIAAGANTLTIRPATGVNATISGSASSIIKLNGADNVTIDGSNNGTASRNLSLVNTSTGSATAVIWVSSLGTGAGSTGNTIKNVNIAGGTATTTNTYGIYAGGTSITTTGTGADNDDLTIENNAFSKTHTGIYASGASGALNDGLLILDNMIGSATVSDYLGKTGINVAYATGATIWGNEIFNLINNSTGNPTGILVRTGFVSSTIERNNIHDLGYTGTSGYGGRGLDINTGNAASGLVIRNNMIANMFGDGWSSLTSDAIMGIRLTGTTGGIMLEHNTVHLSGSFAGSGSGNISAALFVNTSVTDVTLRNNILSNSLDNTNLTTDKAYAIYSSAAATAYTVIDYNDYWVAGPAGVLGYIGSDRTTLAAIQTGFGQNTGSVNIQPFFVSASDAHLVPGLNFNLDNLGTPLAAVTTDIDGEARSATAPDMGADEFTSPLCTGAVGGTASTTATPACGSGSATITATGFSSGAISTYQWEQSADNTNWTSVAGETDPTMMNTGSLNDTTYYRLRVTCNTGTATAYSNTVTITINPNPVVTVTPPSAAICPGGSVSLTASGNSDTYTWSPAAGLSSTTGPTVTASPSTTTTYTVTGTLTASGCTTSQTVTVTVHPSVSVTATPPAATICNGQSVSLNAVGTQNSSPIRITELTAFRTGTGQTPTYPPNVGSGDDLVEISNLSTQPHDASGMELQVWTGTTLNRTWTVPAGTIIPGNGVMVVHIGTGTDNAANLFFNTGGSNPLSSSTLAGVLIKSGTTIVDALAVNSYVWPAASTVTTSDWSGNIPSSSGRAGVIRSAPTDNNTAADWVVSNTPSPLQSIGTYNGGYTSLSVNFTYAWTPVTGLSDPAIANPVASPTSDITYTVTATETNTGCTATSTVTITVNQPPAITTQPASQTVCPGSSATFTVVATGAGLTYQWRKDGTAITGANAASYTIPAASAADVAGYDVVVTGTCSPSDTSNVATLALQAAPVITTQPQSQTVCAGQNATFTVAATGTGLTYQWQKNGVSIGGATSTTFTITGAAASDAASYTVIVTGTCGLTTTSNAAVLTVDQAPLIGTQPVSQTVCSGSNVTFSVSATGVGLTYQWYRNGTVAIAGATTDTYTITGATAANAGQYHVVVNSSCGTSVTSSTATLTVNTPPAITVQPASQTACLGSNVTFNVTATGSGLTYQWKKNGTDIAGATSSSLTISNVTAADLGAYTVVVTGVCGSPVTSSTANLAVSATNTWLGTANSDWNNATNWCAGIPTSASVILIPQGTPFSAILLGNGDVRDLTIQTGATLTIGAGGNLSIYGNVVNSGTITAGAGTVTFAGTTPQSIPALTAGYVVMNGAGGVTLGGTLTVGNSLTLTNGNITLGTNNLILPGGAMGSVSSHIITNGTGVVTSNNINIASVIFPVGPDAASYNPVMIANGGGRNYSVRVSTGITPTIFNPARAINRTWNVSVNTAPATAASITFGYADAHANASAVPTANMEVGRHTGTAWQVLTPAGGVAPFGVPALRTVTTQSVAFGPMVVANVGGILNPTSLPNIDTDITSAVLMPNAFESSTVLRLNVLRTMKINWTIRDAQGKVVMTFSLNVSAGVNDIPLMLRHLAGGTYYMVGETDKGRTGVLRFIRL